MIERPLEERFLGKVELIVERSGTDESKEFGNWL